VKEMFGHLEHSVINYDRFYTKLAELHVCPGGQVPKHCNTGSGQLQLDQLLVQLGHVGKLVLPTITLDRQPNLIIDYSRMQARTFARTNTAHRKHALLEKCRMREDENAQKLASKYKCSVVAAQSALVALLYHLSIQNDEDFKLPFSVKYQHGERAVILEKPLVDRRLSRRERNEKFYKKALSVSFVKRQVQHQVGTGSNDLASSQRRLCTRGAVDPRDDSAVLDYDLIARLDSFGTTTAGAGKRAVTFESRQETSSEPAVQQVEPKQVDVNLIGRSGAVSSILKRNRPASMDGVELAPGKSDKAKKFKGSEEENKQSDEDYEDYDESEREEEEEEALVIADSSDTENKPNVSVF
jgi:hypothetical protein